jgi:hypothetical protein
MDTAWITTITMRFAGDETNKSEQFNDFAQWPMFGGEGVIAENVRHAQRKVIKYSRFVANRLVMMSFPARAIHDSE